MKTSQSPRNSLQRIYGRGLLLSTMEKACILTKVKITGDGSFIGENKDWNDYWRSIHILGNKTAEEYLDRLYVIWQEYIESGFSAEYRQNYCYRYFSLLNVLFSIRSECTSKAWSNALHSVLGFECFKICSVTDSMFSAGGTSTLRNPCYLLSRLKMHAGPDTPQYLPVITVSDTINLELYFHYRQYTISKESPISLLLFPAVTNTKRLKSFKLLNALAGSIRYAADPWTNERAAQIYQSIVRKIIDANKLPEGTHYPIEFVDVGAGTGSLASRICEYIRKSSEASGFVPKFRLWSVDLEPTDPSRYFRNSKTRGFVDSLVSLGDDYRNWLSQPQPLPPINGLRIAFIFKLLDVFSFFSIESISDNNLALVLSKNTSSELGYFEPTTCLAPDSIGVKGLAMSNSRLILQQGFTFPQLSLANYYRGLYLLTKPTNFTNSSDEDYFLPIRSFNPECLITPDGKSVVSRLSEYCDYIIIEDADLRPQDLIDHCIKFSLTHLNICNVTKALKLKSNYAYVICSKIKTIDPLFSGEQIW